MKKHVLLGWANISDAARILNISRQDIYDLTVAGVLPKKHTAKGFKQPMWKIADLEKFPRKLVEAFGNMQKCNPDDVGIIPRGLPKSVPEGYYSQQGAARLLGVPIVTFRTWLEKKEIPYPANRFKGYQNTCYSQEDIQQIKQLKKHYFEKRGL